MGSHNGNSCGVGKYMSRKQPSAARQPEFEDESLQDSEGDYSALPEHPQPWNCDADKQIAAEAWTLEGGPEGRDEEDRREDWENRKKLNGSMSAWFVAPILLFAVLAISSAGVVLKTMSRAAPLTRAGWRLQTTAVLLFPAFIWQWCRMSATEKHKILQKTTLSVVFISALSLAVDLGLWVWSLDHTSLPHSLLLVSMAPAILSAVKCIRCQAVSKRELGGVALGVIGLVLVTSASQVEDDKEVTLVGDAVAFIASVPLAVHLSAGHYARGWMPLFVYSFPVTAGAAILLAVAGVGFEGWSYTETGLVSGPFNWARREFLLPTIYLAAVPGLIGHTTLNGALRYTSSLVVAVAITTEPVIGTLISWAQQQSPQPGLWTCIGGALLIAGTLLVIYASQEGNKNVEHFVVEENSNDAYGDVESAG